MSSIVSNMGSNGLLIALGGLTLLSLVALLWGYQKIQQVNKQVTRLQHDLRVANSSAISMGQQIIHLEKQMGREVVAREPNTLNVAEENVKPSATVNSPQEPSFSSSSLSENTMSNSSEYEVKETSAYDQARRLLAQGQSVSDVAKQCGLSHAEVSLLHALSKKTIPSH